MCAFCPGAAWIELVLEPGYPAGDATTVQFVLVHADGVLRSVVVSEKVLVAVAAVVFAQSHATALVWLNVVLYPAFAKARPAAALPRADHRTEPVGSAAAST